jgi:hypothetical protein
MPPAGTAAADGASCDCGGCDSCGTRQTHCEKKNEFDFTCRCGYDVALNDNLEEG